MRTSDRRTRALMLGAFSLFAALLLTLELFEYGEGRETRRSIDLIRDDSLVSVQLVGRITADVYRERILIDRHVFERDQQDMAAVERDIAAVRADYGAAARDYSPLATSPGEPFAWHTLASDVAAAQRGTEPALALSRQNRDSEANQAMAALAPLYEKISRDATALFDINQDAAGRTVADVTKLHRANLRIRLALIAAILIVVVAGGVLLTRAVVRAQRRLLGLNHDLENRNRELDAFAGRVAHDLKGPLTTITMSADLVASHAPDAKHATAAIGRGVHQIASLIDDLLLLSRVGSMPRETAATESIAAALGRDLAPLVDQASGTLRLELAPAQVSCSPGLLRQVLWNLGENAVKYRRPDVAPAIEITGKVDGGRYVIRVSDNGLGMSTEDARRAFEPFYRARVIAAIPGTGLGLSIVRRIVEASGGRITLESAPGRGSTFVVVLPLAS